ncbi:hypothetical protein U9M48_020506 [Paspalum notatum var. saurae]|uniref:Uncharacterized protein n=1 Tax=Paspalum notatum var. saurae TaxID=547442 RepID=A0AAQ3THL4_PASNO
MEKRFSSPRLSSLSAVMYALVIVAAITVVSFSVVVHCSEAPAQDTSATVAYPNGWRQGPAPPAPLPGRTQGPGAPACCD